MWHWGRIGHCSIAALHWQLVPKFAPYLPTVTQLDIELEHWQWSSARVHTSSSGEKLEVGVVGVLGWIVAWARTPIRMLAQVLNSGALDSMLLEGIRRLQQSLNGGPTYSPRLFASGLLNQPLPVADSPTPLTVAIPAAEESGSPPDPSPGALAEAAMAEEVRSHVAEQGRRGVVFSEPLTPKAWTPVVVPKSAESAAAIGIALRNNLLFAGLEDDVLQVLEDAAEPRVFEQGHVILSAGEPGTHFYLIIQGTCEVAMGGKSPPITLTSGGSFGEVALLYAALSEQTVTVKSEDGLSAWVIDRHTFLHATIEAMQRKRELYGCVCGWCPAPP